MNKTTINKLLKHDQAKVLKHIVNTKSPQGQETMNYSFLPPYESFDNEYYYELLRCMDKNQIKNMYIALFCKWKQIRIYLDENYNEHKYKSKIILPYREVQIDELNMIFSEFIDGDKVMGIFIINMLQRGIIS